MIKRLCIFMGLALFIFMMALAVQWMDYARRPIIGDQGMTFQLKPGTDSRTMLSQLSMAEQSLGFSPLWFEVFIRVKGVSHKLKAGEYQFEAGMSGADVINHLVDGDVHLHAFTIVEGWSFEDLLIELLEEPSIKAQHGLNRTHIQTQLGLDCLDGMFFPETYFYPKGTTLVEFLQRAHRLMEEQVAKAWAVRGDNLAISTPFEAQVLASIIEKESNMAEEWPVISQVFHLRLQKRMRLQADPTVIFGVKDFEGTLTSTMLKEDTPYNTYTRFGLPPTPIAMPSFGALLAAVRPSDSDYLYFVAKPQGPGHVFSTTLKEHQQHVNTLREHQA